LLKRAGVALAISLPLSGGLIVSAFVVDPSSRASKALEVVGTPEEALVTWLVPGHTLVQPLADWMFLVIINWTLVFIVLSLIVLGTKTVKKAWRR
jgi:hypothetical protein